MTNEFLESVFARCKLPDAVLDTALASYKHRYAHFFALNPYMGARMKNLFPSQDDDTLLGVLLEAGDPWSLEAVLSGSEVSDHLIDQVLNNWSLSVADQLRLCSQRMSRVAASCLAREADLMPAARRKLTQVMGVPWVPWVRNVAKKAPRDKNESTYNGWRIDLDDERHAELAGSETLDTMPLKWGLDSEYIAGLAQVLVTEMGNGASAMSRGCWHNFFMLVDAETDAPIREIVSVARRLTVAGLSTV